MNSRMIAHKSVWRWASQPPDVATDANQGNVSADQLETLSPATQLGETPLLCGIVTRGLNCSRQQPRSVNLTRTKGLESDRWAFQKPNLWRQISLVNLSVAYGVAQGKPATTSGDNLLVDADISETALPVGARFTLGTAQFEVTPEKYLPCKKYRARFGNDAFMRALAEPRFRGLFAQVIGEGTIKVGDSLIRIN